MRLRHAHAVFNEVRRAVRARGRTRGAHAAVLALTIALAGAGSAVAPAPAAAAAFNGATIVARAAQLIGTPYGWGAGHGPTPGPTGGQIDCSGLTRAAYAESGIDLGRGATHNQIQLFDKLGSSAGAVPGDLIFYGKKVSSGVEWRDAAGQGWDVTHVAVFKGSGRRIDALPTGGVMDRSLSTSMTTIGYFRIKPAYATGAAPPAPAPASAGQVYEASSANAWQNLPTGVAGASAVTATSMNGVKYVYSLVNGQVYEAASNNEWRNLPTGITGASAVAATSMNGVKYVYTLVNGQVYEAASNNAWQNLPTGITSASAVAVTSMSGVKYIYTLVNGQVYEAASNNGWRNLPTGASRSVPGGLAAVSYNGVKYFYTS